ncbi:MAG: hypothetical protein M3Z24_03195 [Chloroflexota bacterium]|nr:hypothetical protein [Chloroflexota bacterium]
MEQETEQKINEFRNVVRYVEETALPALASYSEIPILLRSGDLKEFPRPSREDQAAEQGIDVLRTSIEQAIAQLYALAFAQEHGLEVPPALVAPVQNYIDTYRAEQSAANTTEGVLSGEEEGESSDTSKE